MYYRIYLMMDVLLFYGSAWYISGISVVLASSQWAGVMRMCTCSSTCVYSTTDVWHRIVNSTYHSSVEYNQLGYMLKSHYNPCLLSLRFFHMYNVCVGCLLTSQMLALCPVVCISWLSGSVELTLRYTMIDIRCRHRQYECDCGIARHKCSQ